jgi:hypothetical protein
MKNMTRDLAVTSVQISGRNVKDSDLLSANFEKHLDQGFYEQTLVSLHSFAVVAFGEEFYGWEWK